MSKPQLPSISLVQRMIDKSGMPTISYNEIDIAQINPTYWRRDLVSYCDNSPRFIPGTVRDNFHILAGAVTDEQILDTFREIGATNFLRQFENFLDFEIKDGCLTTADRGQDGHWWELTLKSEVPGVNYKATFEVPVKKG